jgi:hypothetical protein
MAVVVAKIGKLRDRGACIYDGDAVGREASELMWNKERTW